MCRLIIETYSADETLPTPFPSKGLDRRCAFSYTLLTFLTLRHSQPNVTRLTIGMPFVYRESDIIFIRFEGPISTEATATCTGWHEWITTLRTEEVLFMISAFTKIWVIERDEDLIDDVRLTVITERSKHLNG